MLSWMNVEIPLTAAMRMDDFLAQPLAAAHRNRKRFESPDPQPRASASIPPAAKIRMSMDDFLAQPLAAAHGKRKRFESPDPQPREAASASIPPTAKMRMSMDDFLAQPLAAALGNRSESPDGGLADQDALMRWLNK